MLGLFIAYLSTLLLAHCSQYLLPDTLKPATRSLQLWLLQTATITIIYLLVLTFSLRPYLAAISTLALLAMILIINQAKYRALREPLVFSDLYLYTQIVKHPRLFLPFLNIPVAISSILIGLCLLYIALQIETPIIVTDLISAPQYYSTIIVITGLCAYLILAFSKKFTLSFEAIQDVHTLGFYNSLVIYTLQAHDKKRQKRLQQKLVEKSPFKAITNLSALTRQEPQNFEQLADIIVIQSESFFDPRQMCSTISPGILKNFDDACTEASSHGQLNVPAWGANTLRTEFAFLSGIANSELEHYRFNPYQYLYASTPTLASHLKKQGYRCIAIHPNSAGFFRRTQAFPLMGFDEFIDISAFDKSDTDGPYISDEAVAHKIDETLARHDDKQPIFLFAITMENHGPLHLETLAQEDTDHLYKGKRPTQHHELSVYLRHLSNADIMLKKQSNNLKNRKRAAILGFYGDHVPSMPDLYDQLNFNKADTKYFVWSNDIE